MLRRTLARHGWRARSDQGWLERVRRSTYPPPPRPKLLSTNTNPKLLSTTLNLPTKPTQLLKPALECARVHSFIDRRVGEVAYLVSAP